MKFVSEIDEGEHVRLIDFEDRTGTGSRCLSSRGGPNPGTARLQALRRTVWDATHVPVARHADLENAPRACRLSVNMLTEGRRAWPSSTPEFRKFHRFDREPTHAYGNAHPFKPLPKLEGVCPREDEHGLTNPNDSRPVDEPGLAVRGRFSVASCPVAASEDQLADAHGGGPVLAIDVVGQNPKILFNHTFPYAWLYYSYIHGRWLKVLPSPVNMLC